MDPFNDGIKITMEINVTVDTFFTNFKLPI